MPMTKKAVASNRCRLNRGSGNMAMTARSRRPTIAWRALLIGAYVANGDDGVRAAHCGKKDSRRSTRKRRSAAAAADNDDDNAPLTANARAMASGAKKAIKRSKRTAR